MDEGVVPQYPYPLNWFLNYNMWSWRSRPEANQAYAAVCEEWLEVFTIKTADTDVLIIALAYRHSAHHLDVKVNVILGIGKSIKYYDINSLSLNLGEHTCKALPFFHAFSGCDCVSSFFNQGKCKMWDRWQDFTDRGTCELSTLPLFVSPNQIDILEKYCLYIITKSFRQLILIFKECLILNTQRIII